MNQVNLNCNLDLGPSSVWLTVTAAQAARAAIAYAQELGDFHCGPDYYTCRANLPSYLIKLCVSGEGALNYDGQSYEIHPGDVFWIDCRRPQHYRTAPGRDSWRVLWVHLYGEPCEAYYQLFLAVNDGKNVARLESDVSVRSTLEMLLKLYREGGNTLQDDVQASALLTQLMTYCIQAAGAGGGWRLQAHPALRDRHPRLHQPPLRRARHAGRSGAVDLHQQVLPAEAVQALLRAVAQ